METITLYGTNIKIDPKAFITRLKTTNDNRIICWEQIHQDGTTIEWPVTTPCNVDVTNEEYIKEFRRQNQFICGTVKTF